MTGTHDKPHQPQRGWLGWLVVAGLAALGGLGAFGLWTLATGGGYLQLQRASNPVHRLVVIGLPAAAGLLVLMWMLSELARLRVWLRWTGRGLVGLGLAGLVGLPLFVVLFDLRLEARGLDGQLVRLGAGDPTTHEPLPAGSWQEASADAPGLVVEGLPGDERLTLDRKTLARKRPDGSFSWHLPRPGPPPARLVTDGSRFYYTGRGPDFEDDVLVAALEPTRGQLEWILHGLGNAISEAVIDGDRLVVASRRPASSAVRLVALDPPALAWSARLPGEVQLPPRFNTDAVEVVVDGQLIRLGLDDGRELDRQDACQAPGVACQGGRIVSWSRGDTR